MKPFLLILSGFVLAGLAVCARAGETELVNAVNREKVNSPADDDDPFPAASSLYFASNRAGRWEIFVSIRSSASQPWGPAKVFLSSPEADYRSPFGMGNTLYFAHNKIPDEKLKELKNFDLVKKTGTLAPLPLMDISDRTDELHPWITPSGKEFFFSRKLEAGWTQFVALGPSPGPIGKALEAGFPPGYHHATLTANGLTMYLQGPLKDERVGIFRSKRAKLGAAWSKPEPVSGLNHPDAKRGDMSPALTVDGARLYFVSDRPSGKGGLDIWSALVKDLK